MCKSEMQGRLRYELPFYQEKSDLDSICFNVLLALYMYMKLKTTLDDIPKWKSNQSGSGHHFVDIKLLIPPQYFHLILERSYSLLTKLSPPPVYWNMTIG